MTKYEKNDTHLITSVTSVTQNTAAADYSPKIRKGKVADIEVPQIQEI